MPTYWFSCPKCGNNWGSEKSGRFWISETCDECGKKNVRPCRKETEDDRPSYSPSDGGQGGMFD
jgi:hypothetical protein